MITKEKLEALRANTLEQQQQAQAMFNQAAGALIAIEAMEALLTEQEALQGEELNRLLGSNEPVFVEPINPDEQ